MPCLDRVEPVDGIEQPDHAGLHHVVERLTAAAVAVSEVADERNVQHDELVRRVRALRVFGRQSGEQVEQFPFAGTLLGRPATGSFGHAPTGEVAGPAGAA
ncbi:MAG: hypothetical protein U0R65_10545 [Candidatus Nanopelagicales bacterium]